MNGDIHLKGKIITENDEQAKQDNITTIFDEALINSLSNEIQNQIAQINNKFDEVEQNESLFKNKTHQLEKEITLSNPFCSASVSTL